jgi:D-sedoheptulose 7-phosphate isomerase
MREPITHVLLDRDGVLADEDADGWRWIDGAAAALRHLLDAGLRVGVATNQSVIGRGLLTEEGLAALHREHLAALDFVLHCPHLPDAGCRCRKPAPGLLEEAARRWQVPAGAILFVGDALTDLQASRAAGTRFALVRTGKGARTEALLAASGEHAALFGGRGFADLGALAGALLGGCMKIFQHAVDEHIAVLEQARHVLGAGLDAAFALCRASIAAGGKLLVCGNGGSAADGQHFAAELTGRRELDGPPPAAIALGADFTAASAIANDLGFEHVFARQVEGLGRRGDVLVALSTSGTSPNVVRAAERARRLGIAVVALTGEGGGALAPLADALLAVPSRRVARIQEVHQICLHTLALALENA